MSRPYQTSTVAAGAGSPADLPAWVAVLILLAASIGLFLTAPTGGDFSWSDAPRHALNGAFLMDMVRDHPWRDPAGWAMQYYIRYPSLTILFYPPFFYAVEAAFYAVMGVSHAVAQMAETLFVFLLGLGAYAFARLIMGRVAALGVALMLIGAPEVAFWGRQVMLDVPAYALGLLGMYGLGVWLRNDRPAALYFGAAALLAAVYTKYNVAFLLVPAASAVLLARGWRVLLNRHLLIAATVAVLAAIPAAFMMVRFGAANVGSFAGRPGDLARDSLAAWLFYAEQMPGQLGYGVVIAAAAGVLLAVMRRLQVAADRWLWAMLITWFVTGYVFFSLISVREPRHDLMALFPVLLLAALAVLTLAGRGRGGQMLVLALGIGTYIYSLFWYVPAAITGYRQVAATVAATAPHDGIVMFSGYRDGNFVFDMREHAERQDLTVLRADKMLLKIAVERIRGVEQAGLDDDAILALLKRSGVSMVIAQADFWQDLPQMARFAHVLQGSAFRLVRSFPLTGAVGINDGRDSSGQGRVDIFVPTYTVEPPKGSIALDLPIVGQRVTGRIGGR